MPFVKRDVPASGTRVRAMYDRLAAYPGRPVVLSDLYSHVENSKLRASYLKGGIESLRNNYGLDVRLHYQAFNNNRDYADRPSTWVLLGRWTGRDWERFPIRC